MKRFLNTKEGKAFQTASYKMNPYLKNEVIGPILKKTIQGNRLDPAASAKAADLISKELKQSNLILDAAKSSLSKGNITQAEFEKVVAKNQVIVNANEKIQALAKAQTSEKYIAYYTEYKKLQKIATENQVAFKKIPGAAIRLAALQKLLESNGDRTPADDKSTTPSTPLPCEQFVANTQSEESFKQYLTENGRYQAGTDEAQNKTNLNALYQQARKECATGLDQASLNKAEGNVYRWAQ